MSHTVVFNTQYRGTADRQGICCLILTPSRLVTITALSDQPVVDTATATEQAKMLIKSGAISAIKSENKNSGFKRSRTLEIKLKVTD